MFNTDGQVKSCPSILSVFMNFTAFIFNGSAISIHVWVIIVILLLVIALGLNLFGFPGNWVMIGVAVLNRFLLGGDVASSYSYGLLAALLLLALVGELFEFLAGVMGTGKAGGSRRAMLLSILGSFLGSMVGFSIGTGVLPVLGSIAGLILGGGLGSLAGAMIGESWKGSNRDRQFEVGKGAFIGRILGTLAKSMVGSLMLVLAITGLFI